MSEVTEGSPATGTRELALPPHMSQYAVIDLQFFRALLLCQVALTHDAEIEVSLPPSDPLAFKSVLNGFRVQRVRGVSSNALHRLKYPVGGEAKKILHTEVTDSGFYAVAAVM